MGGSKCEYATFLYLHDQWIYIQFVRFRSISFDFVRFRAISSDWI
jgi:hypothetical protein